MKCVFYELLVLIAVTDKKNFNNTEKLGDQIFIKNMDMTLHAIFQISLIWSSLELYKLSCDRYQTFINYGAFQ